MKKLIKKLTTVLVVGAMLTMGLTGCQAQGNDAAGASEANGELPTIGIVQITEHLSLDMIRESMVAELETLGYVDGETVHIDYQNAQNDQSNLNSICNKFVGDDVDVIVAIATPSAQAAAGATSDIPIIFSAVTDPIAAKLVTDLEHPTGNVTGTSDAIPIDQVFELCNELTPDVKTMGFLYTASEVNSQAVVEQGKAIAAEYGLDYEEMTITNTSELKQAAESLAGKVDAIYTPIDNTIASAMPVLAQVGKEMGIPVYVGADSMVMDGGYATIGINYENLGKQTAEMVNDVLEGKVISEMPVQTLNEYEKVINKTVAKAIGAKEELDGAIIVE